MNPDNIRRAKFMDTRPCGKANFLAMRSLLIRNQPSNNRRAISTLPSCTNMQNPHLRSS